jgi:hypothetical protein
MARFLTVMQQVNLPDDWRRARVVCHVAVYTSTISSDQYLGEEQHIITVHPCGGQLPVRIDFADLALTSPVDHVLLFAEVMQIGVSPSSLCR